MNNDKVIKKDIINITDLTSGNLFSKIIVFALPAMLTTIIQLLYVTVDLLTVSNGDSEDSMGAIATNSPLINLIIVVFTGMAIGVNAIISEAKGAKNKAKAERILHTAYLFSIILGILVGIFGIIFAKRFLLLMNTNPIYIEKASLYLKIYFAGLPFLMVYNYSAQLLKAQGDSFSPFISLLSAGLINIIFDLIFVYVFNLGVIGVGVATIISEFISALLCTFFLHNSKHLFVNLKFKSLRIEKESLKEIIKIGLPAGLQGFFFSLPNVFIQASLYTIDPSNTNLTNGASAAANIESYYYAGVEAISMATMTFIATNIGAKKKDNIKKIILYGFIWGFIYCLIMALITLLFKDLLLSLFIKDKNGIDYGKERLQIMGYTYILDFTMIFTANILRGFKRSFYPMITTLIFCTIFRIIMTRTLFQVDYFHTIFWLYSLYPISWILATINNVIGILIWIPKDYQKIDNISNIKALETK